MIVSRKSQNLVKNSRLYRENSEKWTKKKHITQNRYIQRSTLNLKQ